ncbi:MAG: hypothetical protein WHU54_02245 [Candidatus Bathyarchaeia archaeon]
MNMPKRPLTLVEYNALKRQICLSKQKLKDLLKRRNTFGDIVKVTDEVLVYEGEGKNKKLKFASKGHIVNQGLIHMINALAASQTGSSGPYYLFSRDWTGKTYSYMRLGTGGNITQGTTTGLTTPVSTPPDSQSGATSSPGGGTYRVAWTATWNAGTLTAITVSEIGLYLYLQTALQSFGWTGFNGAATALFSRLSAADGDFTAFQVNPSVPLTVEWRLTFTFA